MFYGYGEADWGRAKAEAREVLLDCARRQRPIQYMELTGELDVRFRHWTSPLAALLDELSRDEDRSGRGLLSALVVRRKLEHGIRLPGPGFFNRTAHDLRGFESASFEARRSFWERELDRLFAEAHR